MKKITIGIPKAFLFYRYNILWTTYLKKLNCKIIYSNNTNKNTIRLGNTYSIDESCLSSKIYLIKLSFSSFQLIIFSCFYKKIV